MEKDKLEAYKELCEVWKLYRDNNYVCSSKDYEAMNNNESVKKMANKNFTFENVLPEPWWGNIKNPNVIILGRCPKYMEKSDEKEYEEFKKKLSSNQMLTEINWLDNIDKEYNYSGKWWKNNVLSKFYDDSKKINKETDNYLYKNIGYFNLVGYHATTGTYLRKTIYKGKNAIPSVQAIVKYVNEIIKNYKPLVIFMWKKNKGEWIESGLDKSVENAKCLNEHCPMNCRINEDLISDIKKKIGESCNESNS